MNSIDFAKLRKNLSKFKQQELKYKNRELLVLSIATVLAFTAALIQACIMYKQMQIIKNDQQIDVTPIVGVDYLKGDHNFFISNYGRHPFSLTAISFPGCEEAYYSYCRQMLPNVPSAGLVDVPVNHCFENIKANDYSGEFTLYLQNSFGEFFVQKGKVRGAFNPENEGEVYLAPIKKCLEKDCHKECNFR